MQAVTVAEDVSGMPMLGQPVAEGGVVSHEHPPTWIPVYLAFRHTVALLQGFDYRLGMGLPDLWVKCDPRALLASEQCNAL